MFYHHKSAIAWKQLYDLIIINILDIICRQSMSTSEVYVINGAIVCIADSTDGIINSFVLHIFLSSAQIG